MLLQIDSACNVSGVSLLLLVKQTLLDEHVHDLATLILVQDVAVCSQNCGC